MMNFMRDLVAQKRGNGSLRRACSTARTEPDDCLESNRLETGTFSRTGPSLGRRGGTCAHAARHCKYSLLVKI